MNEDMTCFPESVSILRSASRPDRKSDLSKVPLRSCQWHQSTREKLNRSRTGNLAALPYSAFACGLHATTPCADTSPLCMVLPLGLIPST